MADIQPLDWQEIIKTVLSIITPVLIWFAGKFIFNRWEKRKMEGENKLKEQESDREASETASIFARMAQDTGKHNVDLRKELNEMLDKIFALEKRVHELEIQADDSTRERCQLEEKNQKLENRVKVLEDVLKANHIAIPVDGG